MLAGTGCCSLSETIQLTKLAADMKYDAAMVVTPYYYLSQVESSFSLSLSFSFSLSLSLSLSNRSHQKSKSQCDFISTSR
jgi:hypothetical protein